MAWDLDRYLQAQNASDVYHQALSELRAGLKTSHWIWFVFPQIAGLGRSQMSQRYALSGVDEAAAYLDHPVLGPRLVECTEALLAVEEGRRADEILGPVEAIKVRSCLTLFDLVPDSPAVFAQALIRFFQGQADPATLGRAREQ